MRLDSTHTRTASLLGASRPLAAWVVVVASVLAGVTTAGATASGAALSDAPAATPDPPALPAEPSWSPLVDQLYGSMLGRPADPGARTYWGGLLGADGSGTAAVADRAHGVAARLAHSTEAAAHDLTDAYQSLLGRAPDSAGLAYWSTRVTAGMALERVWEAIAATPEFADRSSTDQVERGYALVLGRAPETAARTFWSAWVTTHGTAALIRALDHGGEYAHRVVVSSFSKALHRTPDDDGLRYWSNRVSSGTTDALSLVAALAGSPESVDYGCDPTAGGRCLLPFPNDRYTRADPATATGRRVDLKPSFTPANVGGVPIDTQQINRSDGFSPGAPAIVQVPGLDLTKTPGTPTVDEPSLSLEPDSPIVVFDATTGNQWPVWAELDQVDPDTPDPVLFVRPQTNYVEGHTYVVALRNLKDVQGDAIGATPTFQAYLDGTDLPQVAGFEDHKAATEHTLDQLASWGVSRTKLYLAWQFTVASTANITGRLVHIRDDAFARLGGGDGLTNDAAPDFTVTSVDDDTDWPGVARDVLGTFEVPSYLTGDGGPGSVFDTGPDGLPQYSGHAYTANFRCIIGDGALTTPGVPSVYGHGLFGTENEVRSDSQRAMVARFGRVYCATDEIGMSDADEVPSIAILQNLSLFPRLVDRLQQGVVNELFLARLLHSPDGFATDPAFQNAEGASVIEPHAVTYDGNSQGGILGGVLTAVSTDITRSVLGTTGTDYATLMDRSTDFAPFFAVLNSSYPARIDQTIALDLIQMQWDRAEPNGYAGHIVDTTLPDTPAHKVLMLLSYGDHQVTNWAGDVEARTIGRNGNFFAECPKVGDDRTVGEWPLWNVPCVEAYPFGGSAVVYNDTGSDPNPFGNIPPVEDDPARPVATHDPHNDPQNTPAIQDQKDGFLRNGGAIVDTCAPGPCRFPPPD